MDRFVIQIQIFLNVLIWDSYIRTRFSKGARSRKKKRFLLAFALLWVQTGAIDLFHNGGRIKYSFVLMLISLTSLATTSKFQKDICFKTRAVGLINIKTKECKNARHLWKWSIAGLILSCTLQGAHYFPFSLRLRVSRVSLQALLSAPKWSLLCN